MKKIGALLAAVELVIVGLPLASGSVRAETVNDVHYQEATFDENTHEVAYFLS